MIKTITVLFGISLMAAILFGGLTLSQSAFAGEKGQNKITICHVNKSTGESKTISVGQPAVEHHLANHTGDKLG